MFYLLHHEGDQLVHSNSSWLWSYTSPSISTCFTYLNIFWSGLDTTPIVAEQLFLTFLVSWRKFYYRIILVKSGQNNSAPADLANFAPFPGINSTLCNDVPEVSLSSKLLRLCSTFLPEIIWSPILRPWGCKIYDLVSSSYLINYVCSSIWIIFYSFNCGL